MGVTDRVHAVRAFAELGPCADQVGAELARALAVLCCDQQHGRPDPCPGRAALGIALVRGGGCALLTVAPQNGGGRLTVTGLVGVGRAVELLEMAAGLRPALYPLSPADRGRSDARHRGAVASSRNPPQRTFRDWATSRCAIAGRPARTYAARRGAGSGLRASGCAGMASAADRGARHGTWAWNGL
jgi:hypothetical protein